MAKKEPTAEAVPEEEKALQDVEPDEVDVPEGEPANGVLVHRIENEEGGINFGIQAIGDVKPLEIPSILKAAFKLAQSQLGVD